MKKRTVIYIVVFVFVALCNFTINKTSNNSRLSGNLFDKHMLNTAIAGSSETYLCPPHDTAWEHVWVSSSSDEGMTFCPECCVYAFHYISYTDVWANIPYCKICNAQTESAVYVEEYCQEGECGNCHYSSVI